jgi:DNA-binding CsgD family transcriptional regulator
MTATLLSPHPVRAQLRRHPALTNRENDVLLLLAQGKTNAEIGQRLGITRRTVIIHTYAIRAKLGPTLTRVELALLAWGLKA